MKRWLGKRGFAVLLICGVSLAAQLVCNAQNLDRPSSASTPQSPEGSVGLDRTLAVQPIGELSRLGSGSRPSGKVRVQGIVLEQRPGEYIIISDSTGTIFVETPQPIVAKVNQYVDVLGEPVWDGARVYLRNATFRQIDPAVATSGAEPLIAKPAVLPVLTNAWQVRDLPPERAAWQYPVRLRGVVTLCTPHRGGFVVQDEISGIYVAPEKDRPNLKTGDLVAIEGVSIPGDYAPCVLATNVTLLGTAPLPQARPVTLFQLATGQEGSQWVEVRGVIREVDWSNDLAQLELADPTGTVTVNVPAESHPTNLLDAVVRIRGVAASVFNERRQLVGVRIWMPSLEYVEIEEPGVTDPFSLPIRPISTLSQYRPRLSMQRRVVVAGVVTFCRPGRSFFMQDGSGGIEVFTTQQEALNPGDRVTVAGYPAFADYGTVLRAAVFRRDSLGPMPTPHKLASRRALDPQLHAQLVQAECRLLSSSRIGTAHVLTLQLGSRVFEARVLSPGLKRVPPQGSLVQVTGIYMVLADEARTPVTFRLIVPNQDFVRVLSKPSWWTVERTIAVVTGVCAIALGALAWVLLLRRQVQQKTELLKQQLEHERTLEEQYRTVFEGAQSAILTHAIDGRITAINPAGLKLLGYSADEIIGMKVEALVAPESQADLKLLREAALAGSDASERKLCLLTKTGERKLVEMYKRATFKGDHPVAVHVIAKDITERERAEAARREAEAMYRSLVEQLPAGVFRKDATGRYVFVNSWFCKLKGVKPELYLGRAPQEVAAIELAAGTAPTSQIQQLAEQGTEHHELIMRTGQTVEVEERCLGADGKERYLYVVKSPVFGPDGKIVGTQGILFDITERKRAEAALAEASSLLDTLLDNIPDAIYFKDRQSRFVRYSKALARLFKVSASDALLGKTDFDFFAEEHARQAYEDEQEIIRTGKPIIGKLEKETHPDGRITWCLTTKMPWYDKDGNIIGTFGISKDATELKRIQDELAYERELLRTLLDNVPDSIYFKDRESRFVRVSRSKLLRSLEHSPKLRARLAHAGALSDDEAADPNLLVGLSDFDILSEEHARAAFEDEQQVIRTGQPIIGKVEKQIRQDGTVYWALTTKMPWRDKDGNIIGTFGISRDITALKEAQAEVERTHRRLVDMSRMAGMAAVASEVLHNVGNVLTSVNTSCSIAIELLQQCDLSRLLKVSELLRQNASRLPDFFSTDPRGRVIPDYLEALSNTFGETKSSALAELTRLRGYIDHIKQIVAMQQSYAKVAGLEEEVEVTQLVEDALRINEAALDRHSVTVQRDFEPVPAILVDKHKVLQILVNLIRNAKYALSDSGRPDRILTLRVRPDGDEKVTIQVIDNGIGIPPENLTRIFAHGFTTRGDGHGFGLHSGALLARELGGELTAHSEGVGRGATFTLKLPLKPPQAK